MREGASGGWSWSIGLLRNDGFAASRCTFSPLHRLLRGSALSAARKQGLGRSRDIRLAHQAFANEKGGDPNALKPRKIGRCIETAFGYHDTVPWNAWRQHLADGKRCLERPQIAIVDTDQPRFQFERAGKLNFIMNFN